MAENPVDKAIRESEQACQMAIGSTPEQYREFIVLISQNKRVGGSKGNPIYATIRLPYMTVDGRVKMARDDHRASSATLTTDTTFEMLGDRMLCKATVVSAMLGSSVDYAEVKFGGSGVDASSPVENAITSAIGRALGGLGYGLYGTGIASADEVLAAMSDEMRERAQTANPQPGQPQPPQVEMASEKQVSFLLGLLKKVGVRDGDKRELVEFAYPDGMTKQQAHDAIEGLQEGVGMPIPMKRAYVRMLVQKLGLDRQAVANHMDDIYGHHNPANLSETDYAQLVDYLYAKVNKDATPSEPDDIYLPGELDKNPSLQDWVKLTVDTCMEGKFTDVQFKDWALNHFSKDDIDDISKLPAECYSALKSMERSAIIEQVKSFLSDKELQGSLV